MWNLIKELFAAFRSTTQDCSLEHYNEGYDAFLAGMAEDDNPHICGSMDGLLPLMIAITATDSLMKCKHNDE
jgi:hypothetical protein